jgi:hypothetical protein
VDAYFVEVSVWPILDFESRYAVNLESAMRLFKRTARTKPPDANLQFIEEPFRSKLLIGVGYVGVNWNTSDLSYQLLAFQVPCFGMKHHLYGPWTISAYFPLGAIAFQHIRWKKKISGELIPIVPATKQSAAQDEDVLLVRDEEEPQGGN